MCLVQNVAINLFPNSKYIFKLDEDIFITDGYFRKMYKAFLEIQEKNNYQIGFIAPIIPINGYSHLILLKKLGLEKYYEEHFEKPMFISKPNRMIENNPEVARFFWGEGNIIPSIDELNATFGEEELKYTACPIRFSIGAILFEKSTFLDMGMFPVPYKRKSNSLGSDEIRLCTYCVKESKAMIILENTVVGHLAFGKQNASMREYYMNNMEKFLLHE